MMIEFMVKMLVLCVLKTTMKMLPVRTRPVYQQTTLLMTILTHLELVEKLVFFFWHNDNQYYSGIVKHMHRAGTVTIVYNDDVRERLILESKVWRFDKSSSATVINASSGEVRFSDNADGHAELAELNNMSKYFGNKPFLRHQTQGFRQFVILRSYAAEERVFLERDKGVPHCGVPADANTIYILRLYKVKVNDDRFMKLKARTSPHGNEDSTK